MADLKPSDHCVPRRGESTYVPVWGHKTPYPRSSLEAGVEWMQLDTGQRAPRIMGRRFQGPMTHNGTAPSHFDLHVWTVRKNPRGTFAQYNRRVSCDAG